MRAHTADSVRLGVLFVAAHDVEEQDFGYSPGEIVMPANRAPTSLTLYLWKWIIEFGKQPKEVKP